MVAAVAKTHTRDAGAPREPCFEREFDSPCSRGLVWRLGSIGEEDGYKFLAGRYGSPNYLV